MLQAVRMQEHHVPEESNDYNGRVSRALRRIIHAADIHSRALQEQHEITTSQLVTLMAIAQHGRVTVAKIAREVHLTPGTLVGIVDRLEAKGFITRMRDVEDRRLVFLSLTDKGKAFLKKAPSPLQAQLAEALANLPTDEQAVIASSLERVVRLMEKHVIDTPDTAENNAG